MYTAQMIVDRLDSRLVTESNIIQKDLISSVRFDTGGETREKVLFLSPCEEGGTLCRSSAGSSFRYGEDPAAALNRILEIFEYYSVWEKDLEKACRIGCTLTELLDLAYPVISCPLIILDNNERLIAFSSALTAINIQDNRDLSDLLHFRSSSSEKIAEFNHTFSGCFKRKDVYAIPGDIFTTGNAFAMNLFHNGRFNGILMIEGFDSPVTPGKLDLFWLLGEQIRRMLNDPSSGLSIGSEEASFLRYLKAPSPESLAELKRDLKIRSWDPGDEKQLLYIRPAREKSLSPNLNHAFLMFNRLFGLIAAEYQDGLYLLVNRRILNERSAYGLILERIRQLSYCAGVSNSFTDISRLPVMAKRSHAALECGDQDVGSVNSFEDRYMHFFFSLIDQEDRELLIHPLPDELKACDRRYGSSLYTTLFVFLKNERNIAKTAKEMGLHRSTLLHRIERIRSIAGEQLEDPETRMRVLLSYHLKNTENRP